MKKLREDTFSDAHRRILLQAEYRDGYLSFPGSGWLTSFLGAGEEKAVFAVCDHDNNVFALEMIDERTYLNGRFVGGCYFFEANAPNIQNVPFAPQSLIGLTFTGLIKAREYVYGYEWARFQFSPDRQHAIDRLWTEWLRIFLADQFREYQSRYKDVHDRNVMFEIRSIYGKGIPVIIKNWLGNLTVARVGIQPIDVR